MNDRIVGGVIGPTAPQDPHPAGTETAQGPMVGLAVDVDADHDVRGLVGDKLNDSERQEVFDAFGPEPDMQPYGRGLRRRLPSILGGDQRWMRMAYSLAFSRPGRGRSPLLGPTVGRRTVNAAS